MKSRILASMVWLSSSAVAASLIWIPLGIGASAQAFAQETVQGTEPSAAVAAPVIPQQVRYAGKMVNRAGDTVEAEFRIYAAAEGGEPLWTETQKVTVGADGSYTLLLGSAEPKGLPQSVFAGGVARWLGVSVERAPEQERVLLASVPYAMKSADAEALAGHAAADFVTQEQLAALTAQGEQPAPPTPAITASSSATVAGSGTTGTIPLWTGASKLGNSIMYQSGPRLGINVVSPTVALDVGGAAIVDGPATVGGLLTLQPIGTATTASGKGSQSLQMVGSTWSSATNSPVPQNFYMAVYPVGNNTASPASSLFLRYSNGTSPAADLLTVSSNGQVNFTNQVRFSSNQTFPGTLKSVTVLSPLDSDATYGAETIGLDLLVLEGSLNSVYPRLATGNAFNGNQSIQGDIKVAGTVFGGSSEVTGVASATGGFLSNGAVKLEPASVATASAGVNSPFLELGSSVYSSSTASAVAQNFLWQAQPSGNDTVSPSANLALLFQNGTARPQVTGLSIAPNGNINFSASQVFPIKGTGGGTITGITTSSPLTGAGTAGSVALGLNQAALVTDIAPSIATTILPTITPPLETTFNGVYAQLAAANTFTTGQVIEGTTTITGTNVSGTMLEVTNSGDSFSTGISVSNGGQYGIGLSASAASNGDGIEGFGTQTAGSIGVLGALANSGGFSNSYFLLESNDGLDAGVWADGANGQEAALIATADNLSAGIFYNDSATASTIDVLNNYPGGGPLGNVAAGIGTVLRAGGPGGICGINQTGNLSCTGQVKAVVSTKDGSRQLETYTVQSSENWVEDYGSGQLNNGSATIQIEPAFAQTVNTGVEFHVFLTPGGDCKGLYVTNKTVGSFEVHELGGGASTIPFDYKIVAKRSGLETQRLVDVTERMSAETEVARLKRLDHPLPHNRLVQPRPRVTTQVTKK